MSAESELRDLCEAVIEGRLTAEGRDRLEELIRNDPDARRFYVEYLHQHANLCWGGVPAGESPSVSPAKSAPRTSRKAWAVRALALALGLSAIFTLGWLIWPAGNQPFATLVASQGCKWDAGTLPTEAGARLSVGRFRLAEGVAKIVFDTGAEVTIEGPAEIELLSGSRCRLRSGRLVAKVPPPAVGFIVDTPTTTLTDYGTEFGVRAGSENDEVQVFDGRVDAKHHGTGRTESMLTGRNMRFGQDGVADFDPHAQRGPSGPAGAPPKRVLHLSTADAKGKDAYVQPKYPSEHFSDILMLVKNTAPGKMDYARKAYLGFDLAGVDRKKILEARLSLTFTPTGMGFASEVPDAEFAVYGLTDESLDGWNQDKVRWVNAPGNNINDGAGLNSTKTVRLGTFRMVQGVQSGTFGIDGIALVDFLNKDTNGLATLIVVRLTPGSGRNDLVHGFAGRDHPELPPPTLRLVVEP